jgi:hypothetical protein
MSGKIKFPQSSFQQEKSQDCPQSIGYQQFFGNLRTDGFYLPVKTIHTNGRRKHGSAGKTQTFAAIRALGYRLLVRMIKTIHKKLIKLI